MFGSNQGKHSEQFKVQAVAMVEELGRPAVVVAEELGLNPSALWRWIAKARGTYGTRGGKTGVAGAGKDPATLALRLEQAFADGE
jgi:transposase